MMGGQRQGFGDTTTAREGTATQAATSSTNPWSDQSNSPMARDLGVNDVAADRSEDSRAGLFDQASNDDVNDRDDMDLDSDDFGGDGDSDYA